MELLAEAFWPGALTIVTHKQNKIPDIVTAGLPSAAVRMPSQPTFSKFATVPGLSARSTERKPFWLCQPD